MTPNTEIVFIVFVAITGAAVLLQAAILAGIFFSLRKTAKVLVESTQDLKTVIIPMVRSTRELVEHISPQIVTVTEGLADLTATMKRDAPAAKASAHAIMDRVSQQIHRLDTMLTASLNAVEKATYVVESTVSAPVRQVNGIIAAIRAVVDTYRSETPRRPN